MSLIHFAKRYALPLWPWYATGLTALAVTNLVTLEIPQLAKQIVNHFAATHDISSLGHVALGIIGLGIFQIIVRTLSRVLVFWPGRTLEANAKTDLFGHILRLPHWTILRFGTGDLISRLSNDMGQLRAFFAFALLQAANLAFLTIFTVKKMASAHLGLTAACLGPLALMVLITRYSMPRMQQFSMENQKATGRLTNRVTEAFQHVHVIQVNAAEKSFLERTEPDNAAVYESNIKLVFIRNVIFPLMVCLAGLSQVAVLFYGGWEVLQKRLSIGDILAFNIYIGLLSFPLTALGFVLSLYQRAVTATARLEEVEREPSEIQQDQAIVAHTAAQSAAPLLEVRHLNWTWGNQPVLIDVSFDLPAGKKLGICGPVGSGKTTLLSLLVRLWDPPRGTIFWRGRDVLDWSPQELRREVGLAQQTVFLFSDTIANNLSMGLAPPSDAAMQKAASEAQISEEIAGFDRQWQTEIGENGIRLSGGQKQRLALARLLLRNPALLVLDDVVSAVDQTTEKHLVEHFQERQGSLIIASHRQLALAGCDEVLLLEKGRIKAKGPWEKIAQHHLPI